MNYQEAREYLDASSRYGSIPGLSRISMLLELLDHPDRQLNIIHVAGTNGKGSVCAYLSSILNAAGYRVGCYTSPAVNTYLERYMINGKDMEEETFGAYMDVLRDAVFKVTEAGKNPPTVFEIETVLAFLYFAESDCDFVILEAGLGGKGDATNVIEHPLMTIITSVAMDHTECLGNTIEEIAHEKAGIIKGGHPVILGPLTDEAKRVIYNYYTVMERNSAIEGDKNADSRPSIFRMTDRKDLHLYSRGLTEQCFSYKQYDLCTQQLGEYQLDNAATAVLAAETLQEMGYPLMSSNISEGIAKARWYGRFMIIASKPFLVIDGAHNPDGVARFKTSLEAYFAGKRIVFVMGVFKDKDYSSMLKEIAPLCACLYAVALPDWNRSLIPGVLRQEAEHYKLHCRVCVSYKEAAALAGRDAGEDGVVAAFGSLSYLKAFEEAWRQEFTII